MTKPKKSAKPASVAACVESYLDDRLSNLERELDTLDMDVGAALEELYTIVSILKDRVYHPSLRERL